MNFGRVLRADCVNTPVPPDPRCADPAFALANPDVCPTAPQLIIKPGFAMVCALGSVQFRAFLIQNNQEIDVTDQSVFRSSDTSTVVIGAASGNATGVQAGSANISASYQDKVAYAELTVMAVAEDESQGCCSTQEVAFMVLVDQSKSMSQAFSSAYSTKLAFAKAAARQFISEINTQKDKVGLIRFSQDAGTVLSAPTDNTSDVADLVDGISQTQNLTEFYDALASAIDQLNDTAANLKAILLISDGEDQTTSYLNGNNPIALLSDFKAAGGIVICLGCRAHDRGYNLLETFSTGGFFLNGYSTVEQDALDNLSGLKGYICAGNCTPEGDTFVNKGALNYTGFTNWDVTGGTVDLQGNGFFDVLPGNGLYVDLAGTNASQKGLMTLKDPISIESGKSYRLSVDLSGNQREDLEPDSVKLRVYYLDAGNPVYLLDQKVTINDFAQPFQTYSFTFTAPADLDVYISIQQDEQPTEGDARIGILLGLVKFMNVTDLVTMLEDDFDDENLTYVPPRCGVGTYYTSVAENTEIINVSGAGSSAVNGVYEKQSDTLYTLQGGGYSLLFVEVDSTWEIIDDFAVVYYTCPEADFPTGPWTEQAGDPEPPTVDYEQLLGYIQGYDCYGVGCLDEPPPVQLEDPNQLPDIEAGFTPPTTYTSTRTACASCPSGSINVVPENLVPTMTDNDSPEGLAFASPSGSNGTAAWMAFDGDDDTSWFAAGYHEGILGYKFESQQTVNRYSIKMLDSVSYGGPRDWTLEGSNDGSDWTVLDTQSQIFWFTGEEKTFNFTNTTAYQWYRLNITSNNGGLDTQNLSIAKFTMHGEAPVQVCKTATEESIVSQADADNKAYAAALALAQAELNCHHAYTSTQQFTANCPLGSFGQSVTKSATATSLVSQEEADANALAQAQAAAEAELDCSLSNNTQKITINDATATEVAAATPYPSVKHLTGLTGLITHVTVSLKGFTHTSARDVSIALRSPSGTIVEIMRGCGGHLGASNLQLVIDDAAGSNMPQNIALTSGTFKPSQYNAQGNYPTPLPAAPYALTLASFIGEDPNGSWSLWVMDVLDLDSGQIVNGFDLTITSA